MKKITLIITIVCTLFLAGCQVANNTTDQSQPTASDRIYLREASKYLKDPTNPKIKNNDVARSIINGVGLTSDPDQYRQLATLIQEEKVEEAIEIYEQLSGESLQKDK